MTHYAVADELRPGELPDLARVRLVPLCTGLEVGHRLSTGWAFVDCRVCRRLQHVPAGPVCWGPRFGEVGESAK